MTKNDAMHRHGGAAASLLGSWPRRAAAFALLWSTLISWVAPQASAAAPNLVGNPSFEENTNGWRDYNGSEINRVAGGADGSFALEVQGPADLTTFGTNDSPNWIATVGGVGTRYRFSARVRSNGSGGSARLQIREYHNGEQQGSSVKTTPVPLTTSWQTITGDYVVTTAGSTLDFQILDIPVAEGEAFLVDMVSIIVVLPDAPPQVSVDPNPTVGEGEALGLHVTAVDPDDDPITSLAADLSALPSGSNATFTPDPSNASGLLSWTPGFAHAGGPYTVRFFAGNALAGVATAEIMVENVDRAPVVVAPTVFAAQDSATLVVEVSAIDPDGDPIDELVADVSQLPPGNDAWFEVNEDRTSGTLTWTPALGASGEFPIQFIATNAIADTALTTIEVARIEHPPVIAVQQIVHIDETELVEVVVSAFDPDGDAFNSLSADLSALPAGADAVFTPAGDHASGVLRWTPGYAHAGSHVVVFTADAGETGSAQVEIVVENVDRAPVVSGFDAITVFEGEPLTLGVGAADPDGEPIQVLSAGLSGLPAGHDAEFEVAPDRLSGTLSWTPATGARGSYPITFTATNALSGSGVTTVVVRGPNQPPVAALTVSPELTSAPMLVTANAAGSTDPDDAIVSYRFDFGDGVVVGPQPSPVASVTLATAGITDVTVLVTDASGASDTAQARVGSHLGNLCTNPSFENTTVGWGAYGGTITRVSGVGRTGSWVFQATKASGSGWGFNDVPDWVPVTAGPGRTYRYLAWVRSIADHGQASLRVQEFLGTTQKGVTKTSPPVTLTDAWQLLSVDYMVTSPGTRLDMKVLYSGSGANEKFLIDDVQVLLLPAGDQPPVVMAPATLTAIAGQPLTVAVRAADPDGHPIASLSASLAALPPGNNASFTPWADGSGGTLAWTPQAADIGPVPYGVTITAANGLSTTVPIEIVVAGAPLANLCTNPGFEINASGWSPYVSGTALSRVNSGRSGRFGIQLAHPSATGWGVNDQLDIVSQVAAPGRTYRFAAWVRSTSNAGKVRMRLQEFLGTTQKGATVESPELTLTNQWQRLAASYTATTAGTRLDMKILNAPVAPGETFLVDDVEVLLLPAGDRPPVVSAPSAITVAKQQPMTVTVTVADPDGDPITTLAADLSGLPAGHGATFTPGPANGTGILSWTPGAVDERAAPYAVTFSASNGKVALASTAITVTSAHPNLCANPGFETNLSGWGTYGAASIARVTGGHTGGFAMRMATTGASSFGTDDTPNVVASVAAAGDRHRFSAWVRSDSGSSPIRLRVYEFLGGVQLGPVTYSYEVPASTTWQLLIVDHTALAAGSTLSLRVVMSPNAPAQSFVVDDVSIQRVPAGEALVAGDGAITTGGDEGDDEAVEDSQAVESSGEALVFATSFAPNPMRGEGTLGFALPRPGPVRVELFDLAGRRVQTLVNESQARAGRHTIALRSRASQLAPGVYLYRVDAPGAGARSGRVVVLE